LSLQSDALNSSVVYVFIVPPHPPVPTLFPYTTLFRSRPTWRRRAKRASRDVCPPSQSSGCKHWQPRSAVSHSLANPERAHAARRDRKSTRLNSSHRTISYAVFCLKKKKRGRRCSETLS